jgi:cation:H+ antiporter
MFLNVAFILTGFVLLGRGANLLVDGASSLARRFRVSDLVVGLTVVALGTSAPELVVSVISSVQGNSGIALGNVLGSNIANICLVLGVAGLIGPIAIRKGVFWREIPFCVGAAVLLFLVLIPSRSPFAISRVEGILLLLGLVVYLAFMFSSAAPPRPTAAPTEKQRHPGTAAWMVLVGLTGLVLGGEIIVRGAVHIAEGIGVSQEMIGLTVVALGTSLPELATALISMLKGKTDMAIGNVIGSNIINTGLVLGTAATIQPLAVGNLVLPDAGVAVAAALLLFFAMFTGKRQRLDRWEAVLLILLYLGYLGFTVWRG